jgi:mannose-6-phosphate isomerase-like protein (cupin superfamily)
MPGDLQAFDILRTFVRLDDEGGAAPCTANRAFWTGASSSDPQSRYMGCVQFDSGEDLHADSWEMHTRSDEVIVVLEGAIEFTLERKPGDPSSDIVRRLDAHQACIVPAGLWHRLSPLAPGKLLFINTRSGTEHRDGR